MSFDRNTPTGASVSSLTTSIASSEATAAQTRETPPAASGVGANLADPPPAGSRRPTNGRRKKAGPLASLGAGLKLAAAGIVALLCLVATGFIVLDRSSDAHFENRAIGTRSVVESGLGVIEYYHSLEESGELTREEAQAQAMAAVGTIRYENDEYFFIGNEDLVMVMHPIATGLNGTDVSEVADANGVLIFQEMRAVVRSDGEGFVEYMWPRPDSEEPQPKLSYVMGFEPWGWIVVSGVYIDDIDTAIAADRNTVLIGFVAVLAVAALIGWVVRRMFRTLRRLAGAAAQIAEGDLSVDEFDDGSGGSIGELARSFDAMTGTLQDVEGKARLIAGGHIDATHRIPGAFGRTFDAMIESLTKLVERLTASSSALTAAADGLGDVAGRVDRSAERTSSVAEAAAASGDHVSGCVDMVAAAIEEMGVSIAEVSRNTTEAASAASEAVEVARHTSMKIGKLGESSQEIGDVVEVIRTIAEQTNLLALNASIESARAGEAGKGFAVVASEVKELAEQTGRATEEIARRIAAIQTDTTSAIDANARIGETIDRISAISQQISTSVDEQSTVVVGISSNMADTATSTSSIVQSIGDVSTAAAETTQTIQETHAAARNIEGIAADLDELVAFYR